MTFKNGKSSSLRSLKSNVSEEKLVCGSDEHLDRIERPSGSNPTRKSEYTRRSNNEIRMVSDEFESVLRNFKDSPVVINE